MTDSTENATPSKYTISRYSRCEAEQPAVEFIILGCSAPRSKRGAVSNDVVKQQAVELISQLRRLRGYDRFVGHDHLSLQPSVL